MTQSKNEKLSIELISLEFPAFEKILNMVTSYVKVRMGISCEEKSFFGETGFVAAKMILPQ